MVFTSGLPDPNKLIAGLADVGQDAELLKIKDTLKAKAEEVGELDIATITPASLESTLSAAQSEVQGSVDSLVAKANKLKPKLISLQEEMAKELGGVATDLGDKLSSAASEAGVSVSGLTNKFTASFSLPPLSGLDAGISKIAEKAASVNPGSVLKGIDGGNIKGLKLPKASLPDVGIPSGADFGKIIPNIQFKKEPEFDEDGNQIGEKIISLKLGIQATAPVADDSDDVQPEPLELKEVAEIKKNPIFGDNGLLLQMGRAAINTFERVIPTAVTTDESTGENFVWEKVKGPNGTEIVPSGYPSYAEFEAQYKKGRAAAAGKMREAVGGLGQLIGQASTAFQGAAEKLSKVKDGEFKVPKPPADFDPPDTSAREVGIDTVTGAAVNVEQIPAIKNIDVADSVDKLFDSLGNAVPPGKDAQEFIDKAKAEAQQGAAGLQNFLKGKPLPSGTRVEFTYDSDSD